MNLLEWIEKIPDYIFPKLKEHSLTAYFIWREACHLFGSIILLTITYLVSARMLYNLIPYVFGGLIVWMSYQEFYLHPRKYGQKLYKGIIDWSAWMLPFILTFLVY